MNARRAIEDHFIYVNGERKTAGMTAAAAALRVQGYAKNGAVADIRKRVPGGKKVIIGTF